MCIRDRLYSVQGIRVIIDRRHLMYVLGAMIDYEEGEHGEGFTIEMPGTNAPEVPGVS